MDLWHSDLICHLTFNEICKIVRKELTYKYRAGMEVEVTER